MILRFTRLLLLPLFLLWSGAASAEVTVTFYSHDFGSHFPHAFVKLNGTVDATGEKVDTNFGFTAVNVSPGILFGSVKGKVEKAKPKYVAGSDAHFSIVVNDAKYQELLGIVAKWRDRPQKSYNLGKRNCVHFVGEIAQLLGLQTNLKSKLFKKPKSYLREVLKLNPNIAPFVK